MKIKDLIKYRSIWMGIAILLVVFRHTGYVFPAGSLLFVFKTASSCGVDIFLFASGIGCYYSYLRDKSPLDFYKRRIIRLAPIYIPFIVVWIIVSLKIGTINSSQIFGNIFGIQEFNNNGGTFNWYIGAIVLYYLLTPYLAQFIERNSLLKCIFLVLFALGASTIFWNNFQFVIIAVRLPIYIIGMVVAKYDYLTINYKKVLILIIAAIIGYEFFIYSISHFSEQINWNYGLKWYPFILITPLICCLISYTANLFEKNKLTNNFNRFIAYLGGISFELFLTHIFIFDLVDKYSNNISNLLPDEVPFWPIIVLVSIIAAILLNKLSIVIRKKFVHE